MNAILAFPHSAPSATDLLPETEILQRRQMLGRDILKAARKAGKIVWTKGKRGTAWYRLADVDSYIAATMEKRLCPVPKPAPYSNSGDSGSQANQDGAPSIDFGMTPELAEHAAKALAQQI